MLLDLVRLAASPLGWVITLLAFGLVALAWGRRWLGWWLALGGLGLLLGFALPVTAHQLASRLERQYPARPAADMPTADAALVLGGGLEGARLPERPGFDLGAAADRVWYAAMLWRSGKVPMLILTGGNRYATGNLQPEGLAMRDMLLELGVPDSAIQVEAGSRTTRENASATRDLLAQRGARRVLLVTSAMHMPRAQATFERAYRNNDLEFIPAPTDVEALPGVLPPYRRWMPDAASLLRSSRAVTEYLGALALGPMRRRA